MFFVKYLMKKFQLGFHSGNNCVQVALVIVICGLFICSFAVFTDCNIRLINLLYIAKVMKYTFILELQFFVYKLKIRPGELAGRMPDSWSKRCPRSCGCAPDVSKKLGLLQKAFTIYFIYYIYIFLSVILYLLLYILII